MNHALQVARLSVLEAIRRQLHLTTLFTAVLLLALPAFVNTFSLGTQGFERVAKDFGFTLLAYFAVGLSLYMSVTALPDDMEKRTLHPLLARPLSRSAYLTGRYLAVVAVVGASVAVCAACLMVSLGALAGNFDVRIFVAAYGCWLECAVLAAAGVLFSTFASPALAGVLTASTWLVGGLSQAFIEFFLLEDRDNRLAAGIAQSLKAVLPHFEVFRVKSAVVHAMPLQWAYVPVALLYATAWIVFLLVLAGHVFGRRDL